MVKEGVTKESEVEIQSNALPLSYTEEIQLILEPKAKVLTTGSNVLQDLDPSTSQNSSLTPLPLPFSAPAILATSLSLKYIKHICVAPSAWITLPPDTLLDPSLSSFSSNIILERLSLIIPSKIIALWLLPSIFLTLLHLLHSLYDIYFIY